MIVNNPGTYTNTGWCFC